MSVNWESSQVAALAANLADAGLAAQRKSLQVVAKAATDVEAGAKSRAPVDTGNLRSSISTDLRGATAEVGPTANYGGFVERGTSRMAAQPYLVPALAAIEPGFVQAMTQLGGEVLG